MADSVTTIDLDEKSFNKAFNRILTAQRKSRQGSTTKNRQLTPAILRRKKPTVRDLARLGQKTDGTPFTEADILDMQARAIKLGKKSAGKKGITVHEVIRRSRKIDVDRANNRVADGSGITTAKLSGMKAPNIVNVRVKASSISKHMEHRVRFRLEEWEQEMVNADSYDEAVKNACAGRISLDCSCGRHQYWYRYIASVGGYQLSPPKEGVFPKIRNPKITGIACKHILKSIQMLQSPAWHKVLAKQMERQARHLGFSDDPKLNAFFTGDDAKEAAKNRKTKINLEKTRTEFKKYVARQAALAKKAKSSANDIEVKRKKTPRKKPVKATAKTKKAPAKKAMSKAQVAAMNDLDKINVQTMADKLKTSGTKFSQEQMVTAISHVTGKTPEQVKKLLK